MELEDFKEKQVALWNDGDYRPIGRMLNPAAENLVAEAGVSAGRTVLDVGTGSGSVAVAAASLGAYVLGVDITDEGFGEARARAKAAEVDVDLRIGDAENLPVDEASFDVVLSSFAAIFAPRHDLVAAEFARVVKPGGRIAFNAWPPDGVQAKMFAPLYDRLPPPPDFVTPPIRWGEQSHVRELFDPLGITFRFERPQIPIEFPSADAVIEFMLTNSGPTRASVAALQEMGVWDEARAELAETISAANEADDGTFRTNWDYLLAASEPA